MTQTEGVAGSLNTVGAAAYLGLGVSTLEKARVHGGGPVFNKLGSRVTYDMSDLDAWKAERKRRNTAGTSPRKGQRRKNDSAAHDHVSP
jgi:hypothetical protein